VFGATRHTRVVGVLAGYLADLVLADPRRGHPVAGFGAAAAAVERVTYRDTRIAGAAHVVVLVGAVSLLGTAHRFGRGHRIRLQVAGGAFPRFARNPGNGQVDATAADLVPTQYDIGLDAAHPSALLLPVAGT